MLKSEFVKYNKQNNLFNKNDKILLGVSGGIDSVVMLHIFYSLGYNIGIAHFNFKLRGEDSEKDEQFVRALAQKYNCKFYCESADTKKSAEQDSVSIQMKARELRYTWFNTLCESELYNYVAVAHNLNDNVETFLLNITRGTGILGLTGINAKRMEIIRPLLFASRKNIEEYCKQNNLEFRQDKSNDSTKYARNKVRHIVVPALEEINPSFQKTVVQNISRLNDVYAIYKQTIDDKKDELITTENDCIHLNIDGLLKLNPIKTYLFEFLSEYNFTESNCQDIIFTLHNSDSGKQFFSDTHRATIDRNNIIIQAKSENTNQVYYINSTDLQIDIPVEIVISSKIFDKNSVLSKSSKIANIDFNKIEFPLVIRKYQNGDKFKPLGMKGFKKVSDFFIDNKFSIYEKENTWLLLSGESIVWIIGYRIDNRYKITENTKKMLILELK